MTPERDHQIRVQNHLSEIIELLKRVLDNQGVPCLTDRADTELNSMEKSFEIGMGRKE